MVITTHPGACHAVCAGEWPAQSKSAAITQTNKRPGFGFACGRETNAFELVIFDTSSFQELPRLLLFSTRGMEDRPESNRRCSLANSVLALVCYLIRVGILNAGLLAVTSLERISLCSLQDFYSCPRPYAYPGP